MNRPRPEKKNGLARSLGNQVEKVFPLFGLRGKQKKQIVALRQEGYLP